jgi:hypothetical protein
MRPSSQSHSSQMARPRTEPMLSELIRLGGQACVGAHHELGRWGDRGSASPSHCRVGIPAQGEAIRMSRIHRLVLVAAEQTCAISAQAPARICLSESVRASAPSTPRFGGLVVIVFLAGNTDISDMEPEQMHARKGDARQRVSLRRGGEGNLRAQSRPPQTLRGPDLSRKSPAGEGTVLREPWGRAAVTRGSQRLHARSAALRSSSAGERVLSCMKTRSGKGVRFAKGARTPRRSAKRPRTNSLRRQIPARPLVTGHFPEGDGRGDRRLQGPPRRSPAVHPPAPRRRG